MCFHQQSILLWKYRLGHIQSNKKVKISESNKLKIRKHFARYEVMGYIIRTSLLSTVFPIVIRDIRDGLFKGISYGTTSWEDSVSSMLRTKLMFDQKLEKQVPDFSFRLFAVVALVF